MTAQAATTPREPQKILISHANSDTGFADKLAAALKSRGREAVRLDFIDIDEHPGLTQEMREALDSVDRILYIVSPESIKSYDSILRLSAAWKMRRPIIPVHYREVALGAMPPAVQNLQGVVFDEGAFDESLEKLIAYLDALTQAPPPPAAHASEDEIVARVIQQHDVGPQSIVATRDLASLLARAKLVRGQASDFGTKAEEPFDVSFSWLLLAFLAGGGPLSRWFGRYVNEAGLSLEPLYAQAGISEKGFGIASAETAAADELSAVKRVTSSAAALLKSASNLRDAVGAGASPSLPPLDARHVMAAYIYDPAGHDDDLRKLGVRRHEWSNYFLGWIKQHHQAELAAWKKIHRERFPKHPPILVDEGPSTHIATDQWTLEDSLGYRAYAYAIRCFMTHPQTRAPLTISIQAPWGGGKTSLMRMIQQELDPKAIEDLQKADVAGAERADARQRRRLSAAAAWELIRESVKRVRRGASRPDGEANVAADGKAADEARDAAGEPRTVMTIRDALDEIGDWMRENTQKPLPAVNPEGCLALTVWFNAWKYESVNQVWAGLVDAIMRQVAARLPLVEREMFWLRLNLKRIDADRLRQRIHERIFQRWLAVMRKWVVALGALAAACVAAELASWSYGGGWLRYYGAGGAAGSVVLGALVSVWKFFATKASVEKEPAAASLGDYLDIPDYNAELGFIHRVEADLRRVLASVPRHSDEDGGKQNLRIVVFIDDLDRCSPTKVAQVVEAVNLFLAGDFNDCMFVMGMDTEMVAAALQAAHKEMIAQLPADAGIPVGWRFMDKFVQLPFLIPPTEDLNLQQYTASLLSTRKAQPLDSLASKYTKDLLSAMENELVRAFEKEDVAPAKIRDEIDKRVKEFRDKRVLSEPITTEMPEMQRRAAARAIRSKIDEGIANFSDDNEEIRRVVSKATQYFRGNPRELKRFVNAFRFNYFLWWAHKAQGLRGPTLDQLLRWSVLSMKWPEVVRWLRRSGGNEWRAGANGEGQNGNPAGAKKPAALPTRLKLLEEISGEATDLLSWQKCAAVKLRLKPSATPWLSDDDLLQFFHEEWHDFAGGERLSDGAGKGLW